MPVPNSTRLLFAAILIGWMCLIAIPADPVPQHDSIRTGAIYYMELTQTENEARFRNAARMDKETFLKLLDMLTVRGGLRSDRKVCAGEKLMHFLHLLTGLSNRQVKELWQHSGSTIHASMEEVIRAFKRCSGDFYTRPTNSTPMGERINTSKYIYFHGCIGALDGTHISAVVPNIETENKPWRNRKHGVYTAVLGCDDRTY
jgi:hypothetical protein